MAEDRRIGMSPIEMSARNLCKVAGKDFDREPLTEQEKYMAEARRRRDIERRASFEAKLLSVRDPREPLFRDRGLSDRTIKALLAHGLDAPERLLFVTEADLKRIPGIGRAAFDEIMCYRERYIPSDQT